MELKGSGAALGWVGVALALAACNRPPRAGAEDAASPPEVAKARDAAPASEDAGSLPPAEWEETSLRGTFVLRQVRTGPGRCRLESVRRSDSQTRWLTEACVAGRDQLVFLSDDGDRYLVLEVLPEFEPGSTLRADLGRAYVMGTVERTLKAGQLLADPEKVRVIGGRYLWLAGVRGEEGSPPVLVPHGVQVSTLDGVERTLGFDGVVRAGGPDAGEPAGALDAGASMLEEERGAPPAPGRAEQEAEAAARLEAEWRARFAEVRGKVASLEKEVESTKARADSIEKDGLPEVAPQPRIYDSTMTLGQRNQAQAIEWLDYKRQIAERLQETRRKLADAESRLHFARDELDELERKARFEAVPLEWRK